MRTATAIVLSAAAAGLAGCAAFGGGSADVEFDAREHRHRREGRPGRADARVPGSDAAGSRRHPAGASTAAATAVRRFATRYINWNAATVTRQMQALAVASIGQARSAMALAAAQTQNDYELRHGGIANSGVVEAVAPLPGRRNQFVVVTREQTTATNTSAYAGLRPAWHVAVAGRHRDRTRSVGRQSLAAGELDPE